MTMDVFGLDDCGLHGISHTQKHDLTKFLDDRYTVRSTIATSQYPIEKWHETMPDTTPEDAILDRLVNNAHRIQLTGQSIRKAQGQLELANDMTQ